MTWHFFSKCLFSFFNLPFNFLQIIQHFLHFAKLAQISEVGFYFKKLSGSPKNTILLPPVASGQRSSMAGLASLL
jgi:hypothetical protein